MMSIQLQMHTFKDKLNWFYVSTKARLFNYKHLYNSMVFHEEKPIPMYILEADELVNVGTGIDGPSMLLWKRPFMFRDIYPKAILRKCLFTTFIYVNKAMVDVFDRTEILTLAMHEMGHLLGQLENKHRDDEKHFFETYLYNESLADIYVIQLGMGVHLLNILNWFRDHLEIYPDVRDMWKAIYDSRIDFVLEAMKEINTIKSKES